MDTYIFTFKGCGFVLNNKDFNPSYFYPGLTPDCIKHNQLILNFVHNSQPTVIIWAHRSSSIMVLPNNPISRTQYNKMVSKNLAFLVKENIPMINIGSEPELLPVLTRLQEWLNYKFTFSKIPFEDNIFWESNKTSNFYLNTLKIFCPGKVCSNSSTKSWLFHDEDHLSQAGANMLLPQLDRIIKKILTKDPLGVAVETNS
jgi:hypothetical protein